MEYPLGVKWTELTLLWRTVTDIVREYALDKNGIQVPLQIFVPHITCMQIKFMVELFWKYMTELFGNSNQYYYTYPTKPHHHMLTGRFIFGTWWAHLEASSVFDTMLARKYVEEWILKKSNYFIFNGAKPDEYLAWIAGLREDGYNTVVILDSMEELDDLESWISKSCDIWIRVTDQKKWANSRFWIVEEKLVSFIQEKIKNHPNFKLTMLHFSAYKWITDAPFYYDDLRLKVRLYTQLRAICPSLCHLNIWGGMHVPQKTWETIDYNTTVRNILRIIKEVCDENNCLYPNIFTEFWTYTVAPMGFTIMPIAKVKDQWKSKFMFVSGSVMWAMPDTVIIWDTFPAYGVRYLNREFTEYMIAWLTCDDGDMMGTSPVSVPTHVDGDKQSLLFTHTWAYQMNLNGWPSALHSHCMLPKGKTLFLDKSWNVIQVLGSNDNMEAMLLANS